MPKDFIRNVKALEKKGYSESSSYAIATNIYKAKHGHAPRLHRRK